MKHLIVESVRAAGTKGIIVAPSDDAAFSALQPLPGSRVNLQDDFWLERAAVNRTVSLAEAYQRLEEYGALPYLRAAADHSGPPPAGAFKVKFNDPHVFKILDSDIFKWLEALAYEHIREPLSPKLMAIGESVIELILRAQDPNGYI